MQHAFGGDTSKYIRVEFAGKSYQTFAGFMLNRFTIYWVYFGVNNQGSLDTGTIRIEELFRAHSSYGYTATQIDEHNIKLKSNYAWDDFFIFGRMYSDFPNKVKFYLESEQT